MICPQCHHGMIPDPIPNRVRASGDYGKVIPCPRCKGSGIVEKCVSKDVSEPKPILDDGSSKEKIPKLVA